jgi:hypothetical protein
MPGPKGDETTPEEGLVSLDGERKDRFPGFKAPLKIETTREQLRRTAEEELALALYSGVYSRLL